MRFFFKKNIRKFFFLHIGYQEGFFNNKTICKIVLRKTALQAVLYLFIKKTICKIVLRQTEIILTSSLIYHDLIFLFAFL